MIAHRFYYGKPTKASLLVCRQSPLEWENWADEINSSAGEEGLRFFCLGKEEDKLDFI